jgi:hypothetical protein
MSLPSLVPGCQPHALFPVSTHASPVPDGLPAHAAPVLRTAIPQASDLWLPTEVMARVMEALPVETVPAAALVCKAWYQAADAARSATLLLRCFEDLSVPGAAQSASFGQYLVQVDAFPPRHRLEGLISLARLQRGMAPEEQEQAFRTLMAAACRLCPEDRCALLCVLAIRLAPSDVKQAAWQPEALETMIGAARTLPVHAQGMIVAALCGNRENLKGASDSFLAQIAGLVASWTAAELSKPGCLFARAIHQCVGSGPITVQTRALLGHFGYYRLPFMTTLSGGVKTSARIAEFGRSILALDLEMPDKVKILAHHDCWNLPWLARGWMEDAEESGVAYLRAMQALPLPQDALVSLLSAGIVNGAALLSMLFAQLTRLPRLNRTVDITTLYINEIIASAALDESSKIILLRARMTGLPKRKAFLKSALPESVPVFRLGPGGDMPFCGLSLIDSLFADATVPVLEAYMLTILRSTLSDAAKCAVLRLDYPDRVHHEQMNIAHGMYNNTVRASDLPDPMKEALWKDVRTLFDRSCVLV